MEPPELQAIKSLRVIKPWGFYLGSKLKRFSFLIYHLLSVRAKYEDCHRLQDQHNLLALLSRLISSLRSYWALIRVVIALQVMLRVYTITRRSHWARSVSSSLDWDSNTIFCPTSSTSQTVWIPFKSRMRSITWNAVRLFPSLKQWAWEIDTA